MLYAFAGCASPALSNWDRGDPRMPSSRLASAAAEGLRRFLFAVALGLFPLSSAGAAEPNQFVKAEGTSFILNGKPYFVAGANNHYLTFGTPSEVTSVLDDAVAMKINTLRAFIQPVIGSLDGKTVPTIWDWKSHADSSDLGVNGVYMLYWDVAKNGPAFNDGPDGLQRVDFLIAEAAKRHLKLIIAFLDSWGYTGGSQQISAWYGSSDKYNFFYRDERTKRVYKKWVRHVLNRVNSLTGVSYKDDPTIFAWELMNEPFVDTPTLFLSWVGEMSAYVKSIDHTHLVSSGHANFSNKLSDLSISTIDFGTWHGYPTYEKLPAESYGDTIRKFCSIGRLNNKPVLLEEFGFPRFKPHQADIYKQWLQTIADDPDCAGWLVWRLVSLQASGRYPADTYDGFDVHKNSGATWDVLQSAAARLRSKSHKNPNEPAR
jgi:mannan endo-1,4-beta-mannosidase